MRRAVHALIAIATIEVTATLLLLPWAWGDYLREHGELAAFMTTKLVGHTAGAVLLLWAGRGDWRTWLLGVYSLLKATQAPLLMLPAFVLELPPPSEYAAYLQHLPADSRLFTALYVPAFLFAPAFLWAFARECPRVHRRTRLDDLARRMVPASVLIGGGLWLACAVTLVLARAGVAAAPVALVIDGTIATLDLLALGGHHGRAARAHGFSRGGAAGRGVQRGVPPVHGRVVRLQRGRGVRARDWVSNYRWSPTISADGGAALPRVDPALVRGTGGAHSPPAGGGAGALPPACLRRGLLGAVAAVPAGALAWLIGRSPERAVGAVIADPLAQSLFAAVGILLLVIAARERILIRLDAWILPETADQRQALADAAGGPGAGRADHHRRRDRHPDGAARVRLAGDSAGGRRRRDPRGRVQRPAGPDRAPVAPDGHRPPAGNGRWTRAGRAGRAAVGLPLAAAR